MYLLETRISTRECTSLYVGRATNVSARLAEHRGKKLWTRAIVFVRGQAAMTRVHLVFIEAVLIEMAWDAKRFVVENVLRPRRPILSPRDQQGIDTYLKTLLSCARFLDIDLGEYVPSSHSPWGVIGFGMVDDDELDEMSELEILARLGSALGCVDISPQPDESGSEMKEAKASGVQLLKPGEDPAVMLYLVDEAFDQVTLPV